MSGATASLPDLHAAQDAATNAQTGLAGFVHTATSLASGAAGSPLHGLTQALGGLQGALNIDVSGLTQRLPGALTTIQNALPADALRFVEDLDQAYQQLNDFLTQSPLIQQIQPGQNLEQTALALVEQVLAQFSTKLTQLGSSLIDADTLARVTQALTLLEQLASGASVPAAGELLEFLGNNLVGVEPDLLAAATAHLGGALAFTEPLAAAALEAAIGPARDASLTAFGALATAMRNFDPADATAYPALEALLQAWSAALDAAFAAVEASCKALSAVVGAPAWDTLFSAYATVLAAIPLSEVPTIDDAVDAMAGMLESLLARLRMSLSPQELAGQVTRVTSSLHDLFADSGPAQVRQIIIDFIGRIQAAIEAVPAEEARQAVSGMLARVKQELQALGITEVRADIEAGFQHAHDFIDQNIGNDLLGGLQSALADALAQFNNIPIAELGQTIAGAVAQVGSLIDELAGQLSSALDELKALLAQLDGLSFQPVADEVIDEIDALKAKLAAINPNSLSEVEKVALQAGLAILRAVDLESMIDTQLKSGFKTIDDQLTQGVQTVLDAWLQFRQRIGGFDGGALVAPVNALLGQVGGAVQSINGTLVLAPLSQLVDQLLAQANRLSPGALLGPLKAPYAQMMATINRANPDVWVAPLRLLKTEIDKLVDLIDITPLLTTLETRERELFAQARQGLADALGAIHLPAPLDGFFDTMKALVLGIADAIFGDPDTAIRQFSSGLAGNFKPSTLFQPLDLAFDKLVGAVDTLPQDQLLAALEGLRSGLGTALPALNPAGVMAVLRQAQGRLNGLSPAALAGVVALPALSVQLSARLDLATGNDALKASLRAQLSLATAPIDINAGSAARLQGLIAAQAALSAALRRRINGLDASGAQAAYARLDANLSRLLPGFLRQPQALTITDVRAGLAALRPSTKARRIDLAVDRFLADLAPLQGALDGSINGFFTEIRNAALLLHPAGLKDAVSGVYTALRAKLNVLDPDALAAELRSAVWDPLTDPLKAIDPAVIQIQLDALFHQLIAKLGSSVRGLIDQIKTAIDAFLAQVRAALAQVLDALRAQFVQILQDVTALLAKLDQLIVDDLFHRLLTLLANLETSFNQQLDRVRHEFDAMLDAIPLGSSSAALAA